MPLLLSAVSIFAIFRARDSFSAAISGMLLINNAPFPVISQFTFTSNFSISLYNNFIEGRLCALSALATACFVTPKASPKAVWVRFLYSRIWWSWDLRWITERLW